MVYTSCQCDSTPAAPGSNLGPGPDRGGLPTVSLRAAYHTIIMWVVLRKRNCVHVLMVPSPNCESLYVKLPQLCARTVSRTVSEAGRQSGLVGLLPRMQFSI